MNGTFKDLAPGARFIFFPEDIPEVYLGMRCDLFIKLGPGHKDFKAGKCNGLKESTQNPCKISDDEKVIEIV